MFIIVVNLQQRRQETLEQNTVLFYVYYFKQLLYLASYISEHADWMILARLANSQLQLYMKPHGYKFILVVSKQHQNVNVVVDLIC